MAKSVVPFYGILWLFQHLGFVCNSGTVSVTDLVGSMYAVVCSVLSPKVTDGDCWYNEM